MSAKVWDVKGALSWPGVDHGVETDDASNNHGDNSSGNTNSDTNNDNSEHTGIAIIDYTNTTATATTPSYFERPWDAEEGEGEDHIDCHSLSDSTHTQEHSAAPLSTIGPHFDDSSTLSPHEESSFAPGGTKKAKREGSLVSVGGSTSDDFSFAGAGSKTTNISPQNKGYSTLWPSEPSESIGDEEYGDRYTLQTSGLS